MDENLRQYLLVSSMLHLPISFANTS
jgi:RNA-binding protein 26